MHPRAVACVALFALTQVGVKSQNSSCVPDLGSASCLAEVKKIMVDEDRFWFGNAYAGNCNQTGASTTRDCNNFDRTHKSIATRMRNSNDSNVASVQQVLNVTYKAPEGDYEACGNMYRAPAVTYTVDPSRTTTVPLFSLNYLPQVTWNATANKTYSLIVWDAGAHILHAFFFNIKGGNLDNAVTAWNYRGPKNPSDRDQPYVFLLYEQTADNVTAVLVRDRIISVMTNSRNLAPVVLLPDLGLQGPVGVSLLIVKTDFFAAAYMKQNRIVNVCPAMLTPKFQSLSLAYNVSAVQLMTSVDVTFMSPETSFSVCCQNVTVVSNARMANPIGNAIISPVYTRHLPVVNLVQANFFDSFYYLKFDMTLLMLDVTDDLADKSNPDTQLMWQIVNIREADLMSGTTTQPYLMPLPLVGGASSERVIMILLLRQEARVQNVSALTRFAAADCPKHLVNRCRFDLNTFIREQSMFVEGATWFRSSPDLFSRHHVIMSGHQTEAAACAGVPRYSSPCPAPTCTGGSKVVVAQLSITVLLCLLSVWMMMC